MASFGVHPSEVTWRAGVDVLCFGGTKNGPPVGGTAVFLDRCLAEDFAYHVKQAGQLASKMRFISAPWLGLFENDVWLRNARHGNVMAQLLYTRITDVPGVRIMFPTESNAVFAELPVPVTEALRVRDWRFHTFIDAGGCRLICSWDVEPETVEAFVADIRNTYEQAV